MSKYNELGSEIGSGIGYIGGQPPFTPGQSISVILTVRNPTTIALSYSIRLSLGGYIIGTFQSLTVQPGATVTTATLNGAAPSAAGTYPVYVDVVAGGEVLAQRQVGSVTVNAPPAVVPDVQIVSLTWL